MIYAFKALLSCCTVVIMSVQLLAQTQKEEIRLGLPLGHTGPVNYSEFSTSGQYALTASSDNTAKVWDVVTGRLLFSLVGHTDRVNKAIYNSIGDKIVTSSDDGTIKIWDSYLGTLLRTIQAGTKNKEMFSMCLHRELLLVSCVDGDVTIFNVSSGKLIKQLKGDAYGTENVSFSPDGNKILANLGSVAVILDATTGKELQSFSGHTSTINSVCFSADGNLVVTASWDKTIKIWDVSLGRLLHTLTGHTTGVRSAVISPDSKTIASCSYDNTLMLSGISAETTVSNSAITFKDEIRSINFSNDSKKIVASVGDYAAVYDLDTRKLIQVFNGSNRKIDNIKFSANGTNIAVGISQFATSVLHLTTGATLQTMFGSLENYSPNGLEVLTISGRYLCINSVDNGLSLKLLKVDSVKTFYYAAYNRDGSKILSLSTNNLLIIWDAKDGNVLHSLNLGHALPNQAEFMRDNESIIILENGYIEIINLPSGEKKSFISDPTYADIVTMSQNQSSDDIITTCGDESARVWSLTSGKIKYTINGHTGTVTRARYSPSGKTIATLSLDGTAKLWNTSNGKLLGTLYLQNDKLGGYILEFSPCGQFLLTSTSNGSLILWDLRSKEHVAQVCLLNDKDFFIKSKSGYYRASTRSVSQLYYIRGLQTIGFDQLDVKYNRPDKVLTELTNAFGNPDTALINSYYRAWQKRIKKLGVDTTSFEDGFSVPESDFKNRSVIQYEQTSVDGKLQLNVWGMDSTYKLDRYNVWVNDVPIFGQRGVNIHSKNLNTVDANVTVTLSEGENKIETSVMNINGIESYRVPLYVRYTPKETPVEKLYFVGIGIDKYQEPGHNLQYSAKDIRDLAKKLKEQYKDNIVIDTLLDEKVTRENVLTLKKRLLISTVNDKVIVAFSGHGLLSADWDYFLSTHTVDFKNPQINGLPYDDLEWLLDSIPARKKLLLIDACHSGELDKESIRIVNKAIDSLSTASKSNKGVYVENTETTARLGLKNSFELMQELFANVNRGTGATVIAASGGTQFAQEQGALKNGVFTYSILELMRQKKDVKVSELKNTVGKRVEELTNGNQKPTSRSENIEFDWNVW